MKNLDISFEFVGSIVQRDLKLGKTFFLACSHLLSRKLEKKEKHTHDKKKKKLTRQRQKTCA